MANSYYSLSLPCLLALHITRESLNIAKVANFRQIWSHWIWTTGSRKIAPAFVGQIETDTFFHYESFTWSVTCLPTSTLTYHFKYKSTKFEAKIPTLINVVKLFWSKSTFSPNWKLLKICFDALNLVKNAKQWSFSQKNWWLLFEFSTFSCCFS